MKIILLIAVFVIFPGLVLSGCVTSSSLTSINSLTSEPERFNGKIVTIECIYIHGWEWTILAENITFSGKGDYIELQPVGQAIWFTGEMPSEVYDKLYQHSSLGAGLSHFGKVRVTGTFDYGGQYGYMNASKYRITATEVVLLDWVPPE